MFESWMASGRAGRTLCRLVRAGIKIGEPHGRPRTGRNEPQVINVGSCIWGVGLCYPARRANPTADRAHEPQSEPDRRRDIGLASPGPISGLLRPRVDPPSGWIPDVNGSPPFPPPAPSRPEAGRRRSDSRGGGEGGGAGGGRGGGVELQWGVRERPLFSASLGQIPGNAEQSLSHVRVRESLWLRDHQMRWRATDSSKKLPLRRSASQGRPSIWGQESVD